MILAPDLFMVGYLKDSRLGALVYNVGHSYFMAAGCLALWWYLDVAAGLPIGIIWAGHIAMDRMMGYGLKLVSGFKDTHLGKL